MRIVRREFHGESEKRMVAEILEEKTADITTDAMANTAEAEITEGSEVLSAMAIGTGANTTADARARPSGTVYEAM